MPHRAANDARFRVGCAVGLVALSVGACSTYDDGLLVGYNAATAATAGSDASDNAGSAPGGAASAGAPSAVGAGDADAGSTGDAGASASAGGSAGGALSGGAGAASAGHAGMGGVPNTGGTGGGSGAGATAGGAGNAASYEIIDDFEDLDGFLLPSHKRNGPWYVFNDASKTGVQSPFTISLLSGANVRPGSTAALHMTASGFTDWGAGVGADFVNQGGKKVPYDASAYSGIRFYAKVGAGSQATLKLLIPTIYSDADGGKCSDTVVDKHCSDHLFYSVTGLKTSWDVYQCNFDDLVQQGFGLVQPSLDPTSVYSMQFTLATKLLPADIWIDDVSFVKK